MTLNLIEGGIGTYENFNKKRLDYRKTKQTLTQVLYILLNTRGREQLDNAIWDFIIGKKEIMEKIEIRGSTSGQNQYHILSIAISLLCVASK